MEANSEEYKDLTHDLNSLLYLINEPWTNTGDSKRRKRDMKSIINRIKLSTNKDICIYGNYGYMIPKKETDRMNKEYEKKRDEIKNIFSKN